MKKYLFIDRDGTLVEEPEDFQIDSLSKVVFLKNVFLVLNKLKSLGFKFVMVTNQDGLGTDSFPKKDFETVQTFILKAFETQDIEFEKVLICPHLEEEGCNCRKPKIGLLTDILADPNWDRENSYFIGDRNTDLELAKNMRIEGIDISSQSWDDIFEYVKKSSRKSAVKRVTKETEIDVVVDLDSRKNPILNSGIKFLDHMLEQIAKHGRLFLSVNCKGDYEVDDHHSVEDIGLCIGTALREALGDKVSIERYGFVLPMDESLASVALDLSGRSYFDFKADFKSQRLGGLSTQMIEHFFQSLSSSLGANLHMKVEGRNDHHKAEALFKALGKCLYQATSLTNTQAVPSTKGVI